MHKQGAKKGWVSIILYCIIALNTEWSLLWKINLERGVVMPLLLVTAPQLVMESLLPPVAPASLVVPLDTIIVRGPWKTWRG